MDKTELLKQYFGHSSFRPGQGEIIDNILSGQDCLGVMPTGAGKSMCYQIPALALNGTTIVISPLISLMKDQVEALVQSGVNAAFINSSLESEEYFSVYHKVTSGQCKILYVAPERLSSEHFLKMLSDIEIPLVAVDEAHCVSHWGQDFRPSYLKITEFVNAIANRPGRPARPVLAAFTATATDIVKQDIVRILGLNAPFSVTTGFDRANLYFEVRPTEQRNKDAVLLNILREMPGRSAIVYCSTRKNVNSVCGFLRLNGINAKAYHAGLEDLERQYAQEDFIYDRCNVMVATNAFGMGIDKSDVSLVVHYNMPKDLESYYQEAGRAGRDGSPARCILLYSKGDVRTAEFLIENGHEETELSPEERSEIIRRDKERLKMMTFYSTTTKCLRHFILSYFGENSQQSCGHCGSCNAEMDTLDITIEAQKIISCIFRMKQRNRGGGKTIVSAILCGSENEQIKSNGYESLSTYGIMKEYTQNYVRELIDFLESQGYIGVDPEYKTLTMTDEGEELVKSRRTLLMKRPKRAKSALSASAVQTSPTLSAELSPEDEKLMQGLKKLRKKLADTLGVPAYVVFSDATLRDMCAKKPHTKAEFLMVSGVGSMKAERYGKQFISVIEEYKSDTANS